MAASECSEPNEMPLTSVPIYDVHAASFDRLRRDMRRLAKVAFCARGKMVKKNKRMKADSEKERGRKRRECHARKQTLRQHSSVQNF